MDRRSLFKYAAATGITVGLAKGRANATIPEHNWDKYDWERGQRCRSGCIKDRFRSMDLARWFRTAMWRW